MCLTPTTGTPVRLEATIRARLSLCAWPAVRPDAAPSARHGLTRREAVAACLPGAEVAGG